MVVSQKGVAGSPAMNGVLASVALSLSAPLPERGHLVLPIVAAGIDAVVGEDLGGFLDEFPERTALVHALRC